MKLEEHALRYGDLDELLNTEIEYKDQYGRETNAMMRKSKEVWAKLPISVREKYVAFDLWQSYYGQVAIQFYCEEPVFLSKKELFALYKAGIASTRRGSYHNPKFESDLKTKEFLEHFYYEFQKEIALVLAVFMLPIPMFFMAKSIVNLLGTL